MKFKVSQWNNNGYYVICCEKSGCNTHFIWKDGTVHLNSTGYLGANSNFDLAKGYWSTQKEAEIFLAGWQTLNPPPPPKLNQVDYEPEYELGTLYKDSVGMTYKYIKLDFGVTARIGSAYSEPKDVSYIQYRWFCVKL